jgi:hypothetical protein
LSGIVQNRLFVPLELSKSVDGQRHSKHHRSFSGKSTFVFTSTSKDRLPHWRDSAPLVFTVTHGITGMAEPGEIKRGSLWEKAMTQVHTERAQKFLAELHATAAIQARASISAEVPLLSKAPEYNAALEKAFPDLKGFVDKSLYTEIQKPHVHAQVTMGKKAPSSGIR